MSDLLASLSSKSAIASACIAIFASITLNDILSIVSIIMSIVFGISSFIFKRREDKRQSEKNKILIAKLKRDLERASCDDNTKKK